MKLSSQRAQSGTCEDYETSRGIVVVLRALFTAQMNFESAAKKFRLTPRELETMTLLAEGFPWKAVAEKMGITKDGVRFHRANIIRKTGEKSTLPAFLKLFACIPSQKRSYAKR